MPSLHVAVGGPLVIDWVFHSPHSEFLKSRSQIGFFCCYLRHKVSQRSLHGWPVDKAGPELTEILQPLLLGTGIKGVFHHAGVE